MKKIIFWTALISVLGLLIGACAKRDDDTATTQWTTFSCEDTTASGSITIGSDTVSGTYLVQTWTDSSLSRQATGCLATTTFYGSPTGTKSVLVNRIVTSSTSFLDYQGYYSDTACTSRLGYVQNIYTNVSVGDQVSGLDNSTGRPTSGYKVTYNGECGKVMGDTDAATDTLNAQYAYMLRFNLLTTGTEKVFGMGWGGGLADTTYDIWGAGDNGTTFSFYSSRGSSESQPSDWDANSGGNTYQR